MCLPGNPHRRFLVWGLLTGVMLVGFGYARDLPGFFAADRMDSLDFALAPFRNLHKFDVVLRIPLILGLAHALTELPKVIRSLGSVVALRVYRVAVGLAVFALLTPWLNGVIAAGDGVQRVPGYWTEASTYLADHDDGSVALELPAAPFGVYTWGNVHDDVLQGLATSPWAVRNVVPLAPARQRRLPRRGHPGGRVRPAAAPARVVPRGERGRDASSSATTSTACSPAHPTRRT